MAGFIRLGCLAAALAIGNGGSIASAQDAEPNSRCPSGALVAPTPGVRGNLEGRLIEDSNLSLTDVDYFRLRLIPGLRLRGENPRNLVIATRSLECGPIQLIGSPNLDVDLGTDPVTGTFVAKDIFIAVAAAGDTELRLVGDPRSVGRYVFVLENVPSSSFVDQIAPAALAPNQVTLATVAMLNTGAEVWTADGGFALANQNGNSLGYSRALLPAGVAVRTNEAYTFLYALTAPSVAGVYPLTSRMVGPNGAFFGAASPVRSIVVEGLVRDAGDSEFTSQVIPATLARGQETTISITMTNTDVTPWTMAQGYALVNQSLGDNGRFGFVRQAVPAGRTVTRGQQQVFDIRIQAPSEPGFYLFQARMAKGNVLFGASTVLAAIIVP